MTRKILAFLVLAALMITSLTGCGANAPANTSTPTPSVQPSASASPSESAAPAKELYNMKIMGVFGATLTQNTPIGQKTMEKIEKDLNLKLEWDVPAVASYKEKVQIALASGTLPDVILFEDLNDAGLKGAVSNGSIIDITTYLNNAPNIMKYTLPTSWASVKFGTDKTYGIIRSTLVRTDGIAYRKDYLDNLGITGVEEGKPITLEKFTEINQKFSEGDPDKNGKADTYGLTAYVEANGELIPLYNAGFSDPIQGAFGMTGWQKADPAEGFEYMDPKFSRATDNFKKFLEYMSTMYKNKWIDPDWPVVKGSMVWDNMFKGKYGIAPIFPSNVKPTEDNIKKVVPEAKLIWTSGIINPDAGKVTGSSYSTGAWGAWCITKSCKNPERVVEMFDYMLSDDMYHDYMIYGGPGVGFNLEGDKRVPTDEYMNNPDTVGWTRSIIRRAGDPAVFISLKLTDDEKKKFNDFIGECVNNLTPSLDGGFTPSIVTDPKFIDYKKRMTEIVDKIIIGELPVSAYDEALDGWYKAGGEQYVKEMNDFIKANAK